MDKRPADVARDLASRRSQVAAALFNVDNSPDTLFVRGLADGGNPTASAAIASLTTAWEHYAAVKDVGERLDAAVAAGDAAAIGALLARGAVTLPDGTKTELAALLGQLQKRVDGVAKDVGAMAEKARLALSQLDAARASVQELTVRAGVVGAEDDPELKAVRAALDRATAAVANDPVAAADLDELQRLVDAARRRVAEAERHRSHVPAELVAARSQLAEIEALVAHGADAYARTMSRIANPPGVMQPLDLRSDGDQALRPWLGRIEQQAQAGSWDAAAGGLAAWKQAADDWRAKAERVRAANAAPVARRNELRGLLDAYRAKGAAHGKAEDPELTRLYAAAKGALYTAPCVLDTAERLVSEYMTAVNARGA